MSTPLWREALTNSDHDLHRAAWLIFAPDVSIQTVKKELADNQDNATPLLKEIVDDDYLYDSEAPGDGDAPVTAIYLLGDWKVTDTLPSLLDILEVSANQDEVHEAVIVAIKSMGVDVLDKFIAWADEHDEVSIEAADILSDIGEGNEKAFNWIANWVKQADEDVEFYIDQLISTNAAKAAEFLNEAQNDNQYSKDIQKLFRKSAREAEKQVKEELEARLAAEKEAAEEPEVAASDDEPDEENEEELTIEEETEAEEESE